LCVGQINTKDSFRLALTNVIEAYPDTDVSKEAAIILAYMNGKRAAADTKKKREVGYTYNEDANTIFIAVIPNSDKNVNQYKINISDFNTTYFSDKTYEVNSIEINPVNSIILVKDFEGAKDGLSYYSSFKLNADFVAELNGKGYSYFLISEDDFMLFYSDQDVDTYMEFFKANYDLVE